jgi:hypothetical protein
MLSRGDAILGVMCQSLTVYGRNAGNEVCSYIDWKCLCIIGCLQPEDSAKYIYIYI